MNCPRTHRTRWSWSPFLLAAGGAGGAGGGLGSLGGLGGGGVPTHASSIPPILLGLVSISFFHERSPATIDVVP